MTTPTVATVRSPLRRWMARHGWTLGVWLLLVALIVWYATLIPSFGAREFTNIVKNGLPFVYLAVGQAVIVIAGGIDLAIGAMMVLTNAAAAQYMEGQAFWVTMVIAVAIVFGAVVLNAGMGWIIHVSRVPDIVVTLAMGFVYSGLALAILPSPGGATSDGFRWLFTGSITGIGSNFWPSLVAIAIPVGAAAWWMTRSRDGLSLYAVGSDRTAAYLSGLSMMKTKVLTYAVGGAFAALAGLAQTAISGRGAARFTAGSNATLSSVAAIVLGGIALTGGTGSVVGAVAAGIILFFLNPILTARGVDPNTAQVIQGLLIAMVMMVAGLLYLRKERSS